ncbi:hypothetical protein [Streptococcus suis]|nr:hypothetical protein [Streptococcus suis]
MKQPFVITGTTIARAVEIGSILLLVYILFLICWVGAIWTQL